MRRLKVDEGEMAASGSAPRPGDRHGEGEHGAAQERRIPLQLEAEVPAQDGLLAPLFQEFGREDVQGAHGVFHRRLDEDDDTHPRKLQWNKNLALLELDWSWLGTFLVMLAGNKGS